MLAPGADRQTLNIGTGQATSIADVAQLIRNHYLDAEFQDRPLPEGDPLGGTADTARMTAALEWEPPDHGGRGHGPLRRLARQHPPRPARLPSWSASHAAGGIGFFARPPPLTFSSSSTRCPLSYPRSSTRALSRVSMRRQQV
ncbi:hypothetical protein ACIPYQ_29280 [Streptomyces sp. NPDC090045]|uniref:hypothetical protein n=1 Tax=Streptomyces sp. NPDC090045 TaxID=3365927 RepID=UPI0037FDB8D3